MAESLHELRFHDGLLIPFAVYDHSMNGGGESSITGEFQQSDLDPGIGAGGKPSFTVLHVGEPFRL